MTTRRGKIDTRSLGLDLGVGVMKFLTGREHLHYGFWEDGVEVCAANLRRAQETYSARLFELLPRRGLRILDVGGGCGETARDLAEMGHDVDIVIPSEELARRCEANTGHLERVSVHPCKFEEFVAEGLYDVCLFSESFQYIPVDTGLDRAAECISSDGEILISDCFRSEAFASEGPGLGRVGGGHVLSDFRSAVAARPLEIVQEVDVTEFVAPSVDLEQAFYNLAGRVGNRVDADLRTAFPLLRRMGWIAVRMLTSKRRRMRLANRLQGNSRNSESFRRFNRYLMLRIQRT